MSDVSRSSYRKQVQSRCLSHFDISEALRRPLDLIQRAVLEATAKVHPKSIITSNSEENSVCDSSSWKVGEGVEDFLTRLPPSKIDDRPWIWVRNPHVSLPNSLRNESAMIDEGKALLADLDAQIAQRRQTSKLDGPFALSKAIKQLRADCTAELLALGAKHGVTCGKWMLFVPAREVDRLWAVVVEGTINDCLGIEAKVATARQSDPSRIICVYTKNFQDRDDVDHILVQMEKLRLFDNSSYRGIYYKPDVFTYLGINSGNAWEIKPSIYASKELLKGKKRQRDENVV